MSEKSKNLSAQIDETLIWVESEIDKTVHGLESEAMDSGDHLKFIRSRLLGIKSCLTQNNGRRDPDFSPDIARLVIDTWPVGHPIGRQLCRIEYEYERLKPI